MIYMAVTADKYELPIATAATLKELANLLEMKESRARDIMYRTNKAKNTGKITGMRIVKVEE